MGKGVLTLYWCEYGDFDGELVEIGCFGNRYCYKGFTAWSQCVRVAPWAMPATRSSR